MSFDQDRTGYRRAPSRPAPYDVIGDFAELRKRAGKVDPPTTAGYTFGEAPAGGKPAKAFTARYPIARVSGTWAAQGGPLAPVHGRCPRPRSRGRSARADDVRRAVRHGPGLGVPRRQRGQHAASTETVGRGKALIFRDGQVFEGAWERKFAGRPTSYTIGGEPAVFAPGQVWVALLGRDRPVAVT